MNEILAQLGIQSLNKGASTGSEWLDSKGSVLESFSPVDGKLIASVECTDKETYEAVITKASKAFLQWRTVPAPKRGEIVRQVGEALRAYKEPLGKLVS